MAVEDRLVRIEGKLDALVDRTARIESNQAADLQRFKRLEEGQQAALDLHAANCPTARAVADVMSRGRGARAMGKAVLAVVSVVAAFIGGLVSWLFTRN